MLLDFHSAQTAPAPAIIAPAPKSSRDEFPSCRNWGAGQPKPAGCAKPQTRLYWLQLDNPTTEESMVIDAEITAGYLPQQGGGEIARLTALVAAEMPGWTITGLSLADAPDVEF
jgi:hypothetical protein